MEYEMLYICGNDILASKREEKIFIGVTMFSQEVEERLAEYLDFKLPEIKEIKEIRGEEDE